MSAPAADVRLSPNFWLHEFVDSPTARAHGIDNSLPQEYLPRMIELANMLEGIRKLLYGVPITVSSGYRCAALNKLVGGQPNSAHLFGHAADIEAPSFGTPYKLACFLADRADALGIGQLIYEGVKGKRWVHVSTEPVDRPLVNRILTISDAGTETGIHEVIA